MAKTPEFYSARCWEAEHGHSSNTANNISQTNNIKPSINIFMQTFSKFLENEENKSDLQKAKEIADNITKILQCKKGGTCMAFATWFTKNATKKGIKDFTVVEGYVQYKNEKHWRQHTWIEMNGEKIDPTFDQFSHYPDKPSYVSKVKARYTPEEYLALDKKYPLSKSDWSDAVTENLKPSLNKIE